MCNKFLRTLYFFLIIDSHVASQFFFLLFSFIYSFVLNLTCINKVSLKRWILIHKRNFLNLYALLIFWTNWTSIYGPNYSTSLLLNLTELDFDLRKLIVYIYFLFHLLYISSAKLRWRLVNKVKTTKQLKKLRWNGKNSSTQKLIVTLKKRTLIDFVAHYARNRTEVFVSLKTLLITMFAQVTPELKKIV